MTFYTGGYSYTYLRAGRSCKSSSLLRKYWEVLGSSTVEVLLDLNGMENLYIQGTVKNNSELCDNQSGDNITGSLKL